MKKVLLTALGVLLVLTVTASVKKSTTKSSKSKEKPDKHPFAGLRLV